MSTSYQAVRFTIIRADELLPGFHRDPYVQMFAVDNSSYSQYTVRTFLYRTQFISNTRSPTWTDAENREDVLWVRPMPTTPGFALQNKNLKFVFEVWDDDDLRCDDFLGEMTISFQEILESVARNATTGTITRTLAPRDKEQDADVLRGQNALGTLTVKWEMVGNGEVHLDAQQVAPRELLASAFRARRAVVENAVQKFGLPSATQGRPPRVGICFSGGGWRALTAACAVLDVLSETLPGTDVKLLDTVSHMFGLSGGSWALLACMVGGTSNLFHGDSSSATNPWLAGERFDDSVHKYERLVDVLLNAGQVQNAARVTFTPCDDKSSGGTKLVQQLGRVLLNPLLGESIVERWGTFLGRNLIGDLATALLDERFAGPIVEGKLPFCVATCVAKNDATGDYDWIEATPFYVRNQTRNLTVDAPAVSTTKGSHVKVKFTSRPEVSDMTIANWMAICGSAMLVDQKVIADNTIGRWLPFLSSVMPQKGHPPFVEVPELVDVSDSIAFGQCRDGGMDSNLPLEPMLFDRQFDIVLLVDASKGATMPTELEKAVNSGACSIALPHAKKDTLFKDTKPLQKFRTAGGTTLLYARGINEPDTTMIARDKEKVLADIASFKDFYRKQVCPALSGEIVSFLSERGNNVETPSFYHYVAQ